MTDTCFSAIVEAIHSSTFQAVLYIAGGASQVVGSLLSVRGASKTMLEAVVPSSRMFMIQLLRNPKCYDGDYNKMLKILTDCKETGCTFLVGSRNVDGAFEVLEKFDVTEELKDLFISIPTEQFHVDISSTEIRKRSGM